MMDSEGKITTYHSSCHYYEPDKDKPPLKVENTILGKLYDCKNFSPKKDLQDFWQTEIDNGKKYCHACVRYGMLSQIDIKKFLRNNGWETLWDEDNWIKTSWRENPNINIDRAGISTIHAYKSELGKPKMVMKSVDKDGNISGTK